MGMSEFLSVYQYNRSDVLSLLGQKKCVQANSIKRQRRGILAILVVSFCILALRNSGWSALQPSTQLPNSSSRKPAQNTTILVWHWPFGQSVTLKSNLCSEHYGIPNCVLVSDRSWFPKADLVVFHNRELINGKETLPLHLPRPQTQRWVWLSRESPQHNGNMRPFAGRFNYTMCYRRDSDIYAPYGWLVPSKAPKGMAVSDFIPTKGKTSLVSWVVSNYREGDERTIIYKKLKKVIPVDIYGGAVNKSLPLQSLIPTISRYYFYLSFENSVATDYITEKLWHNAFRAGTVPVVWGPPRKQYEAVVPKNSFIHVKDFGSVEELGRFLKTLAEDKERYAAYFTWRLNHTVKTFSDLPQRLCSICPQAISLPKQKVYNDLHGWNWS